MPVVVFSSFVGSCFTVDVCDLVTIYVGGGGLMGGKQEQGLLGRALERRWCICIGRIGV